MLDTLIAVSLGAKDYLYLVLLFVYFASMFVFFFGTPICGLIFLISVLGGKTKTNNYRGALVLIPVISFLILGATNEALFGSREKSRTPVGRRKITPTQKAIESNRVQKPAFAVKAKSIEVKPRGKPKITEAFEDARQIATTPTPERIATEQAKPSLSSYFKKSRRNLELAESRSLNATLSPQMDGNTPIGLRVMILENNSILSKRGLKLGDIILELNGTSIVELELSEIESELGKRTKSCKAILERKNEKISLDCSI